ncbi:MAG: chromosome segregation protein SMC [Anaerolineaceae bacterium]|nr:chromosome segregation protein SMC [Anaerolineaceae bacterium]
MPPRLKSLELHGYKTFASRTIFEFPADITAVVGPNGSGKSNISDSIRWVLGEQSYSLLRGRKTEDMIFAGSEQRSRAGMASATITFDNEDGWLPIDFSEVSITRRAYRDGQNEYLLNGQRVRLKEISELLAQSGLAERTYTIIGQGLVDAALSLKPEERRRLFEEAAGIGLYRSRREEAINRLDSTRRNLERVQDIVSELQPRLQSLEKQARRVQEYERVKADLQVLLREWYGYHWHQTQKEMAHAREVLKAQETRQQQAHQKLVEVEEQMNGLRVRLTEVRSSLNNWHNQSAGLHGQRERISRDLAVKDERQRALQEQQQSSQSDLARLEEEEKAQQARLLALQSEKVRLQTELDDARMEVSKAQQHLASHQQEREQIERSVRETRRMQVDNETKKVRQTAHLDELRTRLVSVQRSHSDLLASITEGEDVIKVAAERLEQAQAARLESESEIKKAEKALQDHRRSTSETEANRRHALDDRARLEASRTRFRAQLEVFTEAEKSFSGLNQGARAVLEASRKGQLPGTYQALSQKLIVPSDYEQAIAAVLGEHLDGVLVDAYTDLENALKLLEQGEKGRAVLLPLAGDWEEAVFAKPTDPESLGVAADLVGCAPDLQPLLRLLLGQVVIVRNRSAARRLRAGLPRSVRLVTLKGEVFWGNGMVVAGQDGRSGVIARPRQKLEIQGLMVDVENDLNIVKQKIQLYDQEINQKKTLEQELDKKLRQANENYNRAGQAYQQASLEQQRLSQQHEWQRGQFVNLEKQIRQTDLEINQINKDIEGLNTRIAVLGDQIREKNHLLMGMPLDELQAQLAHWNTTAAVALRAVKDTDSRLEEYQQNINNNGEQQAGVIRRLESTGLSLGSLENEKSTLRASESKINEEIELLQKQIEPSEKELEAVEQEYTQIQTNHTAVQQALTVAERYLTQAQLEVSRHREALDTLQHKVEEDFGLVAFEYDNNMSGPTPLPLDGMVQQLPSVVELTPDLEDNINRSRGQLRRIGAINPDALSEFQSVSERYEFLTRQVDDLNKADIDLRKVIAELDELMKREFRKTFDAVAAEFRQMFTRLFGGGSARLILTDEDDPSETGIDIEAKLPGRREQGLSLLSGGERSLTAAALVFSLLKVSPTPFCALDEVDAMLDEANVGRFCDLLVELSKNTQFIVITHNRNTVQSAGVIYGVTMGRDSASQVISLKLDEISEEMVR